MNERRKKLKKKPSAETIYIFEDAPQIQAEPTKDITFENRYTTIIIQQRKQQQKHL